MNNRKQVKPRQNGMFKRFTLLVVGYIRERFVWARRKPDTTDADHDKRIAESYVFDDILGIYVPRSEFEKRAKFNSDGYKPTSDEIRRFPNRPKQEQHKADNNLDYPPAPPPVSGNSRNHPRLKPSVFNRNRNK